MYVSMYVMTSQRLRYNAQMLINIHAECKGRENTTTLFVSRITKFNMKQRNTLHCAADIWQIFMRQTHVHNTVKPL